MQISSANWLIKRLPASSKFEDTLKIISNLGLNTVCQSAKCPNIWDCFGSGIATFLILGKTCTRNCSFCSVKKGQEADEVDFEEPFKIREAVEKLNLSHVVITSVTRDDLPDYGATQFYKVLEQIHSLNKKITVEVLTPDFCGSIEAIDIVIKAEPDIYNHNLETVPRLYPLVRPQAIYIRSLNLLKYVKKSVIKTKSGIMVGLGEKDEEIIQVMKDLRGVGVDMLTIGQYIRPSLNNIPVYEFVLPEKFIEYKNIAYKLGFENVVSMPFARSSLKVGI